MDLVPARPPRAAHRLRRHRRRDPGDQRRRRRPLPAQAVGPAGGEALPGRRRADRDVARRRRPRRSRRSRSSATGGRRRALRGARLPRPQRRARTAGTTASTSPEGRAAARRGGRRPDRRPGGDHPRRHARCWRRPTPRSPAAVGPHRRPGDRLLRPDRGRRRPGRASARAVYGASEGLRTVLVERQATGGQAGQSSRIENYLGFPDGVSGAQLTDRARRQAVKFGAEMLTARDVVGAGGAAARRGWCGSATAARSPRTR